MFQTVLASGTAFARNRICSIVRSTGSFTWRGFRSPEVRPAKTVKASPAAKKAEGRDRERVLGQHAKEPKQ